MLSTVHVSKVVSRRHARLTKTQRRQHEFLSLLEQPRLSPSRSLRLQQLWQEFAATMTSAQLEKLLRMSTPSEQGFMRIPRSCAQRPSHFLVCDSEDPATFLPVKSTHGELDIIPVWEEVLVRNASGHGHRVHHRQAGHL